MNKNAAIGLLVAVIVIGGGYLLVKKPAAPVVETPTNSNPETPAETPVTPAVNTPGTPAVVTSSTAGPSNSGSIVTGTVKPNGALTTYWFDYGETSALGTRNAEQSVGSGYASIPAPAYISGLKANTLYYYRLSAKNRFGTITGATYSFSTNGTPPPQGVAPTTKTSAATSIARTTVNLNGQVDPNGFNTTYWFEYGKDNDLGSSTSLQAAGNGNSSSNVSVSLSDLSPLTKYYFRLNAQNPYGTVNGAIMSFTTKGPSAATTPEVDTTAAANINTTNAQLTGRIDPNGAVTTYWFEYSEDSLLGSLIGSGTLQQTVAADAGLTTVRATITGLRTKTTYFYRLIGRNSEGTVRGDIETFKTK